MDLLQVLHLVIKLIKWKDSSLCIEKPHVPRYISMYIGNTWKKVGAKDRKIAGTADSNHSTFF